MLESDPAAMDENQQTLTCFGCRAPVNAKLTTCPICGVRRPPEGWRDEGAAEQGLEAPPAPDNEADDESETSAGMGLVVRLTKAPAGQAAAPPTPAEPHLRIAPFQRPLDGPDSVDEEELEILDDPDEDTQGEDMSAPVAATPLQIRVGAPREDPTDEVSVEQLGAASFAATPTEAEATLDEDEPLAWRALPVGLTVLGRYRIERQMVDPSPYASYVSVQEPMVRRVVLTLMSGADVLPESSADDRAQLEERFLADASAASNLRHPHVARVLDFGQAKDGTCYVISELVHGLTLQEILARGKMPAQRSVGAMLQVARGVAAIHEAGLVHKNVTADQVVIELEGSRDKARLRPPAMGIEHLPQSKWIHASNARYQAPEVLAGDHASAASDVFALGVLLHRVFHGTFPFDGDTAATVGAAQRNGLKMPANSGSPRVDALIQRCLAEVSTRTISAFEIIEELREIGDLIPASQPVPAAQAGDQVPETAAPMPYASSLPPQPFTMLHVAGITVGASLLSVGLAVLLVVTVGKDWFRGPPGEVQTVEVIKEVPVIREVPAPTPAPVAVQPTPEPAVVEAPKAAKPRTAWKPRPRNTSKPAPVTTPARIEEEPVTVSQPVTVQKTVEPVAAPEPSPPPSPSQLLSGSWVGRTGSTALNFQLAVDKTGLIGGTAKVVDSTTSEGAREGAVRGHVTPNADGTWSMELSMTSGGVTTTYAGVLAGDQATGKVTEDGKSKGKFVLAR
jgi:hypothetical protein